MMVFAGASNIPLAQKVAKEGGMSLGEIELSRFANDESRVLIKESKVSREVAVVQSLGAPTDHNLIEFCLICDAIKRMGAREITAVIPWLGYSKQDKVFRTGEPLSVKVIAKILSIVPLERVITFDLHNPAILGFFEVPVTQLSAREIFLDHFRHMITPRSVVVAPDAGSAKVSSAFATDLGLETVYVNKKRDLVSGEVTIKGISAEVTGAEVIIVDDMIVTGGTLVEVAKYLKTQKVESVNVAATHHLYVPGTQEKLDESGIDTVVVSDTIRQYAESPKLRIVSVAKIIADELCR